MSGAPHATMALRHPLGQKPPAEAAIVERTMNIARGERPMPTFIAHPAAGGPFAPVLLLMDMWGIRWIMRDTARAIAAAGYYCIMPDLYYRLGEVRYAPHDITDRPLSFPELEPARQAQLRMAMDGLTETMVEEDVAVLLAFMESGEPVRPGPVGQVGYCMGGRHALAIAGTFPERIKATACLHGAGLTRPGPDSPHLVARNAAGEIYCGHAELDRYAAADVVEQLDRAMAGRPVRYRSVVHRGAQHSYAVPDRDVFDAAATAADWQAILAMFSRQLT